MAKKNETVIVTNEHMILAGITYKRNKIAEIATIMMSRYDWLAFGHGYYLYFLYGRAYEIRFQENKQWRVNHRSAETYDRWVNWAFCDDFEMAVNICDRHIDSIVQRSVEECWQIIDGKIV